MKNKKSILIAAFLCIIVFCSCEIQTKKIENEQSQAQLPPKDNEIIEQQENSSESASKNKFGYKELSEKEQQVYDDMLACILNYGEQETFKDIDADGLNLVYQTILADYGEIFWISGYKYTSFNRAGNTDYIVFAPTYNRTISEKKMLEKQIEDISDSIILNIKGKTDYEKSKYLYEYIINNTKYTDENSENQNIIGVLIDNKAVCQGYANTYQYLLDKAGIQAIVITGISRDEDHAWVAAKLDNSWYYTDPTWGDMGIEDNNGKTQNIVSYEYLNMTQADARVEHVENGYLPTMPTNTTEDNYFIHENKFFKVYDSDALGQVISEASKGSGIAQVKYSTKSEAEKAINDMVSSKNILKYLQKNTDKVNYIISDQNVLTIIIR